MKKTLLVRMDRLGDLVLTLPVEHSFEELKNAHWWIPKGLGFVAKSASPQPKFSEIEKNFSLRNFRTLYLELKKENYSSALIYYAPSWVYLLLFLARVPLRAGRHSQWYSFVFLNRGVRQKRSLSEKSELLYNFELTRDALSLAPKDPKPHHLVLTPSSQVHETLKKFGLNEKPYCLIHPGMGGSALNWPTESYRKLILSLLAQGECVILTGTAADKPYTDPLMDLKNHPGLIWLAEKLSGPELIDVLSSANWVLAPSTGVVHLAASLGTLTYGIYSTVREEAATRWGPQGPKVIVLTLDSESSEKLLCPEENCSHPPCSV